MIASSLVERSLEAGWKAATNHRPPGKPESPKTGWREALLWNWRLGAGGWTRAGCGEAWGSDWLAARHRKESSPLTT